MISRALFAAAFSVTACSAANPSFEGGDAATTTTTSNDAGGGLVFGDASMKETGPTGDGGDCDPPDMMIVLDRSDSMKSSPSGGGACRMANQACSMASQCCSGVCTSNKCVGSGDGGSSASKWTLAVEAVDLITQAPTDQTMRFGLELLPDVPCVSVQGQGMCGSGVIETQLGLGNGAAIATTLGATQLELGTPIGGALHVAETKLASVKVPNRKQFAMLVTDGGETCTADGPLPVVQSLAASGIDTFVIGFGAAVDAALLNDLACAGMTAKNFSSSCTQSSGGYVASVASTTHVYYDASDGPALKTALATITNGVCCGCNVPVN